MPSDDAYSPTPPSGLLALLGAKSNARVRVGPNLSTRSGLILPATELLRWKRDGDGREKAPRKPITKSYSAITDKQPLYQGLVVETI